MSLSEVVQRQEQEVFDLQRSRTRLSRLFVLLLFTDVLLCAAWLALEHYLPRGGP
jgi:phosphopantetheinyl transferase